MENYTYEDVKKAYMAIVAVGRANVCFGAFASRRKHVENLFKLDGDAKELYKKLVSDKEINY